MPYATPEEHLVAVDRRLEISESLAGLPPDDPPNEWAGWWHLDVPFLRQQLADTKANLDYVLSEHGKACEQLAAAQAESQGYLARVKELEEITKAALKRAGVSEIEAHMAQAEAERLRGKLGRLLAVRGDPCALESYGVDGQLCPWCDAARALAGEQEAQG